MGREALAVCHWKGETAEVKALLEPAAIILRGDIRATIPRQSITAISVADDALTVVAEGNELSLELGSRQARAWAAALSTPLPTLAEKLGIDVTHRAFVLGQADDTELAQALVGAVTNTRGEAAVIVAILTTETDLTEAIEAARATPNRPVWCVYGKGRFATITDATIRRTMRERGFVDNKVSAVSERLTATRYQLAAV
jgi:hypothetical protein